MGKISFWQSLRKNKWLASTGMLAAGALAVYGVWQMPSMNQYHMETLDTPMLGESKQQQNVENSQEEKLYQSGLPKDSDTKDVEESKQKTEVQANTASESQSSENKEKIKQTKKIKVKKKEASEKQQVSVEVLSNPQVSLNAANFDESTGISWPIDGDVILNYDTEGVVYFQTLAQYKANPAIMIAGEVGQKVKAATGGIVKEIKKEEETGVTLTIDAGNSYEIIYGQLDELNVSEGDTVTEGAVLGTLAEPTDYFSIEGPNLYFQVLQENTPVNPLLLLK